MELIDALESIENEYKNAREKFKPMYNFHEAYGIIKEEFDEFFDAVKSKSPNRHANVFKEIIQVGAMCLSVLIELDKEDV